METPDLGDFSISRGLRERYRGPDVPGDQGNIIYVVSTRWLTTFLRSVGLKMYAGRTMPNFPLAIRTRSCLTPWITAADEYVAGDADVGWTAIIEADTDTGIYNKREVRK